MSTYQGPPRRLRATLGADSNKTRIYKQNEMHADHVTAWSKGGGTELKNLTMLCQTHNRAKGNR
jgi:5-methylcytosine-specific restriction endonuclease McrA